MEIIDRAIDLFTPGFPLGYRREFCKRKVVLYKFWHEIILAVGAWMLSALVGVGTYSLERCPVEPAIDRERVSVS